VFLAARGPVLLVDLFVVLLDIKKTISSDIILCHISKEFSWCELLGLGKRSNYLCRITN